MIRWGEAEVTVTIDGYLLVNIASLLLTIASFLYAVDSRRRTASKLSSRSAFCVVRTKGNVNRLKPPTPIRGPENRLNKCRKSLLLYGWFDKIQFVKNRLP